MRMQKHVCGMMADILLYYSSPAPAWGTKSSEHRAQSTVHTSIPGSHSAIHGPPPTLTLPANPTCKKASNELLAPSAQHGPALAHVHSAVPCCRVRGGILALDRSREHAHASSALQEPVQLLRAVCPVNRLRNVMFPNEILGRPCMVNTQPTAASTPHNTSGRSPQA